MPRILIVDDDPINRELLHAYLEGEDHELLDADAGEEALRSADRWAPDMVPLDVMMPSIGGFETRWRPRTSSFRSRAVTKTRRRGG
jgi:CheY-like chemotaxis protein